MWDHLWQKLGKFLSLQTRRISPALTELSPEQWRVLHDFIQECLHSRNEPIDCRLILFNSSLMPNERLIQTLLHCFTPSKKEPVFSKVELQSIAKRIEAQCNLP